MSSGSPSRADGSTGRRAFLVAVLVGAGASVAGLGAVRFDTYVVQAESMASTLLPGDVLVVDAWAGSGFPGLGFGDKPPAVGEVWVFAAPTGVDRFQVKRVVGLPGDTIAMHEASVHLNGLPLAEPYLRGDALAGTRKVGFNWQLEHLLPGPDSSVYDPSATTWGPLVVPDSSYFVLGDNRAMSIDSRHQGFVRWDRFRGRVKGVLFSYGTLERETFPADQAVRWNRIGRLAPHETEPATVISH